MSPKLGNYCSVIMGQAPPGDTYSATEGTPLIAGAGDFSNGQLRPKKFTSKPSKLSKAGDIVLSIRASIGDKVWADGEYCLGRGVAALRPSADLDRSFLWHWLNHAEPSLQAKAKGATFLQVNRSDIADLPIALPPLDEQRRIAAILDKADELRTKRREALAHLDTLMQSIFHSMFDPFLLTNRATVGDTGIVQLGRQRAPKYQSGKHTRPYMRVANVKLNRLDLSDVLRMDFDEKDFKAYQLNHGDILLNEGQSTELVGRPALWRNEIKDCCFQNTLVRYVADPHLIIPEFALATFLYYFHRGEFAKISSKTSSIAHLGAARFARMPMPTPPLELQQTFSTRVAAIERLKAAHRKHLAQLDALFASLQHRAFKGEV